VSLDKDKLRDLPGWENNAPVPICMGGDYRALTFCCKPGFSLTFGFKCSRDEKLSELGITHEEFIKLKEDFSKKNNWDSEYPCFGSISYCCMRAGGCPRRDIALVERYPGMALEEIMKIYFGKKKELARIILESVSDPEKREKIKPYFDLF
jgi:predicted metal-binding transcription factor (methanogenesis marker protein 9)